MDEAARALIDTDTLSGIQKKVPAVVANASRYLASYPSLTFSIITRYEVLRGLRAKNAHAQQTAFQRLCDMSEVIPITDAVIDRAASIYADLYQSGALIGDADILIAATALEHNLVLVTNNARHFSRIQRLTVASWHETVSGP